jgi:hypothetical protein
LWARSSRWPFAGNITKYYGLWRIAVYFLEYVFKNFEMLNCSGKKLARAKPIFDPIKDP